MVSYASTSGIDIFAHQLFIPFAGLGALFALSGAYTAQAEEGFIHGAPERAEVWSDYLKAFSEDYYAVTYTTRGFAPSSSATDVSEFTVTSLATDTKAIAKALG